MITHFRYQSWSSAICLGCRPQTVLSSGSGPTLLSPGSPSPTGEPVEAWRRTAFADFSGYIRALFERKRADPRHDLVSELVVVHEEGDALSEEELLHYSGPLETATVRYASTDIDIDGVTISRGDQVVVVLPLPNCDDTRFACADQLDITRVENRHLAFGKAYTYWRNADVGTTGRVLIRITCRLGA
jgi:cytochrome P450